MEHPNSFGSLDTRPESSDDTSSDGYDKKKSTSKPSRKFEVSHAQSRKEEAAGKGLFSILNDSQPKVFEVQKTVDKPSLPAEKTTIEPAIDHERRVDTTEATAELDAILPEEKQTLTQNILEAEGAALQQEMQEAMPGSDEAAEVASAASFINEVSRRIEGGEPASEILFDEALSDVIQDLGLDLEAGDDNQEALEDAVTIEGDADDSHEDDAAEAAGGAGGASTARPGSGAGGTGSGGASGGGPTHTGGGSGAGGVGGGTPPPPPPPGGAAGGGFGATPPPGGGAGPPFPVGPVGGSFGPMGGGLRPPVHVAVEAPARRNGRRELLVGGLVGYLIGRRRGRIKTEKKLLPIQKSLERQVKDLSYQITDRELKIRQLTVENLQKDKTAQLALQKNEQLKRQDTQNQSSELAVEVSERVEVAHKAELTNGTEARVHQAEKLAAMIVPVPEKVHERGVPDSAMPQNRQRSRQELLESAAKIRVDDTSLKQLLEQGKIKPEEAEKAVELYLEGNPRYEKILQDEVLTVVPAEKFETLRKRKPENPSETPAVQQSALVAQEGVNPEYSPVAAMNSQLSELLSKDVQENKNHVVQFIMWGALVVVAVLAVGLMLFLAA